MNIFNYSPFSIDIYLADRKTETATCQEQYTQPLRVQRKSSDYLRRHTYAFQAVTEGRAHKVRRINQNKYLAAVLNVVVRRISQTFLLVPNFHWIVVEDSMEKTPLVANLLAKSGIPYTHLNAGTPKEWKLLLNVNISFMVKGLTA